MGDPFDPRNIPRIPAQNFGAARKAASSADVVTPAGADEVLTIHQELLRVIKRAADAMESTAYVQAYTWHSIAQTSVAQASTRVYMATDRPVRVSVYAVAQQISFNTRALTGATDGWIVAVNTSATFELAPGQSLYGYANGAGATAAVLAEQFDL